jgi:hypothetical protein
MPRIVLKSSYFEFNFQARSGIAGRYMLHKIHTRAQLDRDTAMQLRTRMIACEQDTERAVGERTYTGRQMPAGASFWMRARAIEPDAESSNDTETNSRVLVSRAS